MGETKSDRFHWLGHVKKMGEDRAVKRANLCQPTGRRRCWTGELEGLNGLDITGSTKPTEISASFK